MTRRRRDLASEVLILDFENFGGYDSGHKFTLSSLVAREIKTGRAFHFRNCEDDSWRRKSGESGWWCRAQDDHSSWTNLYHKDLQ
jgi:hypothetical protein